VSSYVSYEVAAIAADIEDWLTLIDVALKMGGDRSPDGVLPLSVCLREAMLIQPGEEPEIVARLAWHPG
jgi:hypothetical protein